ncbi:MAG TPA: M56 family metallopeptidase, partial [Rhizomicrobium sp.]|nr:M56 family metallopeptidase [Rhizomicrobium sp.]
MTSPVSFLSSAMVDAIAWGLIHFLWQGAAVAALAAAAMGSSRHPSVRYMTGVGALALMPAMPVATVLLFDPLHPSPPSLPAISAFAQLPDYLLSHKLLPDDLLPGLVQAWLAGVAFLSLRFTGGFLLLERKCRRQSAPPDSRTLALCREVQQRLGLDRGVRYLACAWLNVPAAIGAFRPVILLPVTLAGLTETQFRAVIAHELAHVRRWDFLVNLFQIFTETLLFYHPAIWWLTARIRAERELCCDEIAVIEAGDRLAYARALTWMAKQGSASLLAPAATHGILTERIFHILGREGSRHRIAGLGGSLFLLTASLALASVLILPGVPVSASPEHPRAVTADTGRSIKPLAQVESPPVQASPSAMRPSAMRPSAMRKHDLISRRKRFVHMGVIKPSPVPSVAMPLPMAPADAALLSSDEEPVAAPSETPGALPHVVSVAAEKLAAETISDNQYPAATLKLSASLGWQ